MARLVPGQWNYLDRGFGLREPNFLQMLFSLIGLRENSVSVDRKERMGGFHACFGAHSFTDNSKVGVTDGLIAG